MDVQQVVVGLRDVLKHYHAAPEEAFSGLPEDLLLLESFGFASLLPKKLHVIEIVKRRHLLIRYGEG